MWHRRERIPVQRICKVAEVHGHTVEGEGICVVVVARRPKVGIGGYRCEVVQVE
jgi:hypothetical protein